MATVPRASAALPAAGADMNAEPITDSFNNIFTFLEATNLDEANVDLTGTDGIVGKSTAQTITGLKSFENTSAAAGGIRTTIQIGLNPATGTPTANDGSRILLYADDAGGTASDIAYIDAVMTTATAGSEVGRLDFYVAATGAPVSQVQIRDGSITPTTTDDISLGTSALNFSDLFLDSGAVINFDGGDVTITHSANTLAFAGASSGYTFDALVSPATNDAAALGTTSLGFSDLHLAAGGVINWANGEITVTETDANTLTISGTATLIDLAAGILEVNNAVRFDTGVAVVSTAYSVGRDADATNQLHFNIPTGATFEWSVNDVSGMVLTGGPILFIGDTSNASMTAGATFNQADADNEIVAFKSSDVAHALTSGIVAVETDTYATFGKANAAEGGLRMRIFAEDAAVTQVLGFVVAGGTADTTKTTAGVGLINFNVYEHNGANALADITANGNVFTIQAYVGAANVTRFLIDEDGDMFTVTAGGTFDDHDDLALVNAYDTVRSAADVGRDWNIFIQEKESELIRLGVLGAPIREGGLTNVSQLQRLHNGAIRQIGDNISILNRAIRTLEQITGKPLLAEKD